MIECKKSKYIIGNSDYVRVTTVCNILSTGDALIQWAANCTAEYIAEHYEDNMTPSDVKTLSNKARFSFRDVSKEARDIGSEVHEIISQYIKAKIHGDELDLTKYNTYKDEVENGFLAFLDWEKINNVEWLDSEFVVHHDDLFYAGRVDGLCCINGRLTLVDFKTAKGFYDGYDLQLYAYKMAVVYMTNNLIYFDPKIFNETDELDIGVLRLDKETGLPEYKDYSEKYNPDAFRDLVNFYYGYKKRRLSNRRTA